MRRDSLLAGEDGDIAVFDPARRKWWTYAALRKKIAETITEYENARPRLIFNLCRNDFHSLTVYLTAFERGDPIALLDAEMPEEFRDRLVEEYRPTQVNAGSWAMAYEDSVRELNPDLALLLPTSGTTGSPKFVRLSRRNVIANADSIAAALDLKPSDRAITSLPIHYSYGLSVINSHLRAGAAIILTDASLTSKDFWALADDAGATSMAGVPYTYQMLRRLGVAKVAPPSLTTLTQAGGRLAPELVSELSETMRARGGRFFVMYGQTEATARISVLPSDKLPEKLGSVGQAIPGGKLRIDDGEVVYEGPNVMMGYAESAADLDKGDEMHGVLRTGDLGRIDDEGFLYITGRAKRFAKVFGLRVNLDDVEKLTHGIGPVAAVAGDDKVIVFAEKAAEGQFAEAKQALVAELRVHHTAVELRAVEKLPLMANGKVDYAALSADASLRSA